MLRKLILLCLFVFTLPVFSQEKPAEKPVTPPAVSDAKKTEKVLAEKQQERLHDKLEKMQKDQSQEKPEKDALDFLDNIDYPELQVVPRASERLESEAQFEREGGSWLNQWSFLLSGASTLAAATLTSASITSQNVDQQNMIKLGQIVGGTTLGVGIYYGFAKPYESAAEKVRRIKGKDKRSVLLRERTAEEVIERNATIIGSISTLTVWANLITGIALASQGDSTSKTYAYASIFASSLSMMFTHPYILNWEKHKEYKHKIYTPIPQSAFYKDAKTGETNTYFGLAWNY